MIVSGETHQARHNNWVPVSTNWFICCKGYWHRRFETRTWWTVGQFRWRAGNFERHDSDSAVSSSPPPVLPGKIRIHSHNHIHGGGLLELEPCYVSSLLWAVHLWYRVWSPFVVRNACLWTSIIQNLDNSRHILEHDSFEFFFIFVISDFVHKARLY